MTNRFDRPAASKAGREPGIVACYRMHAEELRGPKTANPGE
jgi:hypothetical protein